MTKPEAMKEVKRLTAKVGRWKAANRRLRAESLIATHEIEHLEAIIANSCAVVTNTVNIKAIDWESPISWTNTGFPVDSSFD